MATITLQGNEIHTNGDLPAIGSKAPDFLLVDKDLNNVNLDEFVGKKKLINIVPSLDTPVCATSTKKFGDFATERNDVVIMTVAADLPFAMSRFCTTEKIENVVTLSMMRNQNFANDYGVLIQDGPLAGITARAVVVLDADNDVIYTQLVGEISDEPDYDAALKALG
jgi:thiol peroxidase|tara:strand:+ start:67 stop:567 length:501 start_codon:yes stop_codon:yes gene_type:complete